MFLKEEKFKCASYLPFPCDSRNFLLPRNAELSQGGKTLTYSFEDGTKLQIVRTTSEPIKTTQISGRERFDKYSFTMTKLSANDPPNSCRRPCKFNIL